MRPDFPFRPTAFPFYYGWIVLAAATVGLVMSAPGQTIGVSVFTESLMSATGLSRIEFSNAYLIGTLASGIMLPLAGSVIDRIGVRAGVIGSSIGLASVVAYLSQVDRLAAKVAALGVPPSISAFGLLTLGFLGLRFCGQGTLTLVCRTMLGRWFERRRGLVSAISGPFASFSFAGSPLVLAAWVNHSGWRGAWLEMALVVGVGMASFGWIFFRETPEECGLEIDGGGGPALRPAGDDTTAVRRPPRDFTRAEALRTAAFWIVTLGIANHAMVITGISLHIVDLGAEVGLSKADSLGIFLPVTLISIPTGIAMGFAIDRFPVRYLIMAMMVGQVLMFGLAPSLGDPLLYWVCIAGWGFSSGFYGPVTVAALPNFFGRTHLGAIQGVMMMILVISSALGPALFAAVKATFGAYGPGLHVLAFLPLVILVVAPFTRDP
jgi:MFS transporter, OFA family, oxalate/formate antiporter